MKIGILREFCGSASLGGAEFSVVALAEAFESFHDVEIVHDNPQFTRENVQNVFGVDLSKTRFLFRENRAIPESRTDLPWQAYHALKEWNSHISKEYDIFINFVHGLPFFCHARLGMLVILFPLFDRLSCWWWNEPVPSR